MNFQPPLHHMLPRGLHNIMNQYAQAVDSDDNTDDDPHSESNLESVGQEKATTYERDERVANERRRQLYPTVIATLPTGWSTSSEHKAKHLSVSHNALRVTHRGPDGGANKTQNPGNGYACAVRANAPIPHACGIYYFEIRLVDCLTGCVGLGVCQKAVNINRLPGWDPHSYGYHGDDGSFYSSSGNGTKYGETFQTGDVVGCGVNLIENFVFFTKNGRFQGIAMRQIELHDPLYPVIGLQTGREIVDVNFGQVPFVYDIYKDMEKARVTVTADIYKIDLPTVEKNEWCKKIISSWLQTEGFSESLEVFNRVTNRPTEEPLELIRARKRIRDLILANQSGDALRLMNEVYPGILEADNMSRVVLILRAQNFVELASQFANTTSEMPRGPKTKASNGVSIGNGTSHPSTSSLLSNPHKRTRSYVSSSASCTDSDGPPTRKVQPGGARMDVDDGMVDDQPCSSRNGCSKNGNAALPPLDIDPRGLDDNDEISTMSSDSVQHGADFTPDQTARVTELVQMGREISSMARRIDLSTNPEYSRIVESALASLVLTKSAFRTHKLLKKTHIRKLATLVNNSIMANYYLGLERAMPSLTLNRVIEWWQLRKAKLATTDCATANFVNDRKIVYGIVSSDDESSIESDLEEDSDDSDASDSTSTSGSDSSSEDYDDDDDYASTVSGMEEDVPEPSSSARITIPPSCV